MLVECSHADAHGLRKSITIDLKVATAVVAAAAIIVTVILAVTLDRPIQCAGTVHHGSLALRRALDSQ